MLAWVFRRCDGEADAAETPYGLVPTPERSTRDGLDLPEETLRALLQVDEDAAAQLPQMEAFLDSLGERLPAEMRGQLEALKARLG